jgi:multicomponent Na+:H+ antiporter subunit D
VTPEFAIAAVVAIPFLGAILIALTGDFPNLRESITLVTATALFGVVAALAPAVLDGVRPGLSLFEVVPGISLAFSVDPLGMLFALVASLLWLVTSVYSIGYMRANNERNQTRFYTCFAVALGSTMGIAFAANLFTLFLFYEALTLSTYPLVVHNGTTEARRGGRVYLGLLLTTSIGLLLFAIVWTWNLTGTLDFAPGGILAGRASSGVTTVLLLLYMFGIGKAALMPFHRWLPAAMVAPTPVSALLHAVAVVKAGVFTVVKVIVFIFGIDFLRTINSEWLVYVAGATILIASLIALRQDNLKLRLAYSTVSQLSYVVIAAAVLAPISVVGAVFHIAAHAAGKITLFFCAGSIHTAAHKTKVSELDGIGRRMPWTMTAFTIGSLSMIGVPPAAGFVSKWYVLTGALAGKQPFVVVVLILSTMLNAAYFLPIVYAAFLRTPGTGRAPKPGEAPWPMVTATAITAAITLLLFFFPQVPLALARAVAAVSP